MIKINFDQMNITIIKWKKTTGLDFARINFFGVDQQINCEPFGNLFDDTYNETFDGETY